MEISLITELAKQYNFEDQLLSPEAIEEYLIPYGRQEGQIDVPYLCRKERISHGRVRNDIQKVFGTQQFITEPKAPNEISKKEFMSIYEFGLYPNVREWIGHVHKSTGKVLTRSKLFQYLTEDNIDQRWEVQPNVSFV